MFQTSDEAPALPQHAMDLRQRRVLVEPVERLRDRDDVGRPVVERNRLGRAVQHLGAATMCARISAIGSTATTCAPLGTSSRVSFPVPAPRSTTVRPGPIPVAATSQSIASGGYARPRALVDIGRRGEARGSDRIDASTSGVTRYASNTASRLRSDVRSVRRLFTSPTSAV